MITLTDFIKQNKLKLKYIEISEELQDIIDTQHSKNRKLGKYDIRVIKNSENLGGINNTLIKDIFSRTNNIIENSCLNNTIIINKSEIGICFRENKQKNNNHIYHNII